MGETEKSGRDCTIQLKRYWIAPDRWDDYLAMWRHIAAVRKRCGFNIPFAFIDREANVFTWAISHADFDRGAELYYADPERKRYSRTDYDPGTKSYTDDSSRRDQRNIEDYIVKAEISFVAAAPIP